MSIGFHTGVLEDRTLDIARAHDQVMTDLLSHGLEKKEQREKEFMELMSVDFVNGLNTRVKEKQQGWIDDFNAAGTQVLKNAQNKWGNVSVDERVKIQNRMQELEQKQESLRQSVAVFDKARETIANPNMAKHFDLDESAERIKEEFKEWDGESLVSAEKMLVPAYANMLDELQEALGGMEWSSDTVTRQSLVDGVTVSSSDKVTARGGMFNPSDRIQFLEDFVETGEISRAATKFMTSDDLSENSKEALGRIAQHYVDQGVNVPNAFKIAAVEVQARQPLMDMFEKKDKKRGTKPHMSRRGPGGKYTMGDEQLITKPFQEEGEDIQIKGRTLGGTISVSASKMQGIPSSLAQGVYDLKLHHVYEDGTVSATYTGRRGKEPIPYINDYFAVDEYDKGVADRIYKKRMGSNIEVEEMEVDGVNRWVPLGGKDEAYTVMLEVDSEIENLVDGAVVDFSRNFRQLTAGSQKPKEESDDAGLSPEEWNSKWKKLPKGETMVGLDGQTYTKR